LKAIIHRPKREEIDRGPVVTASSPELTSGTPRLPEIRTLLLDDSRFDRKRIRRMGDGLGLNLHFHEADSVRAMRDLLDRQSFDLFLIDYMMPEADGLAALEVIRNHSGQTEAVAIMISGQADQRVAVNAIKAGCQDFILKSEISPEFLRSTVVSALHRSQHFSAWFDQPGPMRDLEALRSLMQIALQDHQIREILRDALHDAARGAGVAYGPPQGADLLQFLLDFQRPDAFEFHSPPGIKRL
jgi:PleD family two-component response regulator